MDAKYRHFTGSFTTMTEATKSTHKLCLFEQGQDQGEKLSEKGYWWYSMIMRNSSFPFHSQFLVWNLFIVVCILQLFYVATKKINSEWMKT